jgi:hypothetical protein
MVSRLDDHPGQSERLGPHEFVVQGIERPLVRRLVGGSQVDERAGQGEQVGSVAGSALPEAHDLLGLERGGKPPCGATCAKLDGLHVKQGGLFERVPQP